MSDSAIYNHREPKRICLLGASFDTGNLGISALAESSIKVILNRWPDAQISLLGDDCEYGVHHLQLSGRKVRLTKVPIRFCKNIFMANHFLVLLSYAILLKLVPWGRFRSFISKHNRYLNTILEADIVADITGGDSFSDMYGLRRFLIFGFLQKWLVTKFNKELIFLPQTYGPCNRSITRLMAKHILKRANTVFARDRSSAEFVHDLLGNCNVDGKVRFCPDVAFVLDPQKPKNIDVGSLENIRAEDSVVVGLNVSGLLFSGGYTKDNMFGLKSDFAEVIYGIIDQIMQYKQCLLLLIPHVFVPGGNIESDSEVCSKLYESVNRKYSGRIFLARGEYDHNEIKYVIGMCDFLIGSRMHACIAALSQCIPAVGLAYSKKFQGAFESIGLRECVVDARRLNKEMLLHAVEEIFEKRHEIENHLRTHMPKIQKDILNLFHTWHGNQQSSYI